MTNPKVIAHLIATNFYGGPEKQIISHARCLDSSRFRFVLISFIENEQQNEIIDKAIQLGIEAVQLHVAHAFDPRSIFRLNKILKENNVDLLCSHGYKANVLGRLATWVNGIPQVAISRGWTGENIKIRFYEILDKVFLLLNDHVVAVSNGQKEKILSCVVPQERVSVIHNAININNSKKVGPTKIREELGLPKDALLVVSAGRLSPEKNYAAMIEMAKVISCENDSIYFVIFGEGILRKDLEQRVLDAGLKGRFFLPGFRTDMPTLYEEIDIFILPSFTEGLPNVALEAFAAQKPIIASAVGGTPEVVQDGISGFLTTPDDIAGMGGKVLKLAADPVLRYEMGLAGYSHVAKNFGFEGQTRKYEELYEAIYNRRHAGPE